jgi:hypothetical protein
MNTSGQVATYILLSFGVVCAIVGFVEFWRRVTPALARSAQGPEPVPPPRTGGPW